MAIELTALQAAHEEQAQALLNAIRGKWDAAQFGPQSAEAILVALNPALQGKVDAVPFDPGRQLQPSPW